MTGEAAPALRREGVSFLTSSRWAPGADAYGALAFIYGTVVASVLALLLAVPVSVGIALFLTEVAPRRLRRLVTSVVDILAAVPSVVFGLWGAIVLAPWIVGLYNGVARLVRRIPVLSAVFGPASTGKSLLTAGIILALMITPIITSVAREVFATTPSGQKEGALALGATRWEMIRATVLPHSRSGVVAAVMLGLGRAMGETIAIALVIGASPRITANLFSAADALPAVIANQFGEAGGVHRSALIALGVLLFAITVAVNMAARVVAGSRAVTARRP